MTDRNAGLVLKTSDFTTRSDYIYGLPYTNQLGSMNAKGSSITWNNINLRTLLGDMYDQFDIFNICLNTISTAQANTIDPNADSRNVNVKIGGLPWINQTYNVKTGVNGMTTTLATFNFTPSSATTQYYYSNNIATFGKNSDTCNLTIEYWRILDDAIVTTLGTPVTNLTGTGSTNSNSITLSSAPPASVIIGSQIFATGGGSFPANTYITAINGTTITISQNLTLFISATALTIIPLATYPNTIFIFDIFGVPKDDGNKNATRII